MKRLQYSIVLIIALLNFSIPGCKNKNRQPPNFIIILADDMGYSDPGCFGGEIQTPNIDRLAENGLRFTQFYNTGRCWPTRSSLMTGFYAQGVGMDPPGPPSPEWAFTIPEYLRSLGYRSYHSGKWHVMNKPDPVKDGGFDHSYFCEGYDNHFSWKHSLDGRDLPLFNPDSGYYSTTVFTDYAIKFINEHKRDYQESPFFLYLAFITPHFPVQAPQEDIDKYREMYKRGWDQIRKERYDRMKKSGIVNTVLSAREPEVNVTYEHLMPDSVLLDSLGEGEVLFPLPWESLSQQQKEFQAEKMAIHAAMVDRIDQEVGRLIDELTSKELFDNTVIFFLSDNGASAEIMIRGGGHDPEAIPGSYASYLCLGPGYANASNSPFRRYKHWTHEGGVATPLVVHWPDGIKEIGIIRTNPGHVVDLLPTLVDLAGGTLENKMGNIEVPQLHGRSIRPAFLKDHSVNRDTLFFSHQGNQALKIRNWKIVKSEGETEPWFLYDMDKDRAEQNDLSGQQPQIYQDMITEWQRLNARYMEMGGYE